MSPFWEISIWNFKICRNFLSIYIRDLSVKSKQLNFWLSINWKEKSKKPIFRELQKKIFCQMINRWPKKSCLLFTLVLLISIEKKLQPYYNSKLRFHKKGLHFYFVIDRGNSGHVTMPKKVTRHLGHFLYSYIGNLSPFNCHVCCYVTITLCYLK